VMGSQKETKFRNVRLPSIQMKALKKKETGECSFIFVVYTTCI
jgi:hypothetical protein